jgi:hypothetical protein
MDSDVDATQADEERQHGGAEQEVGLEHHVLFEASQERGQGKVNGCGQHRVAARKAGRLSERQVKREIGTRAVEHTLEQRSRERCAEDRRRHEPGGLGLPSQEQVTEHGQGQERQHGHASERREVPHHLFEPGRAERIARIVRVAQGEQEVRVDPLCIALAHFRGHLREHERAERQGRDRHERAEFALADPAQERAGAMEIPVEGDHARVVPRPSERARFRRACPWRAG